MFLVTESALRVFVVRQALKSERPALGPWDLGMCDLNCRGERVAKPLTWAPWTTPGWNPEYPEFLGELAREWTPRRGDTLGGVQNSGLGIGPLLKLDLEL